MSDVKSDQSKATMTSEVRNERKTSDKCDPSSAKMTSYNSDKSNETTENDVTSDESNASMTSDRLDGSCSSMTSDFESDPTWVVLRSFYFDHKQILNWILLLCVWSLICAFVAMSLAQSVEDNIVTIVIAALCMFGLVVYVIRLRCGRSLRQKFGAFVAKYPAILQKIGRICWVLSGIGICVVIIVDATSSPLNLIPAAGLFLLLFISLILSENPSQVDYGVIWRGVLVQLLLGVLVIRCSFVQIAIQWIADLIASYLDFAKYGAIFVFGETYYEHEFAFAVATVLFFFTATTTFLYHVGALQIFVGWVGGAFSFFIPVSRVEAFAAASSIFFGPEATIVMVKMLIPSLTISQLHLLFTTGLSTIDAGLIPVYQSMGIPASQLVSASLMSAPAAVIFSKILCPDIQRHRLRHHSSDDDVEEISSGRIRFDESEYLSGVDAFRRGSEEAVAVVGAMISVLLAFVSLVEFVNATLTWFGQRVGIQDLTLQVILSYVFLPLAFLMGCDWSDCFQVAELVGVKTVVNEFVAYVSLSQLINNRLNDTQPSISPRSEMIATYALCGYSNIGTAGFMVGFLATLDPRRKGDISQMAWMCLLAGSFACFSTACTAGIFYKE